MAQFTANFSYVGESDGVLMAGLADDQYETVNYLLFQKAIDASAQDVELGHDQVHVTLSGGTASCYGGVESINLALNGLEVRIDSDTAEILGATQCFVVSFEHGLDGLYDLSVMLGKLVESFIDKRDQVIHSGTVRNFVFGHNMLKRIMYATQEEDRQGRCPSAAHPACRAR